MKKVVLSLASLSTLLSLLFIYERIIVHQQFGPTSMLAAAFLVCFSGIFLATYFLYDSRFRQTIAKFWMIVVSVSFTYLVIDFAAGFFLITRLSPEIVPDPYRHHKLVANTYSKFEQRDFSYIQRVNNAGLRGQDIAIAKPEGHYRIIMLGDSFTMGKGVEDDETFSAHLNTLLNHRSYSCEPKRIEVLNAGVDSYSPVLSYIQLTRDLARLNPDTVILNLDVSDLVQENAYRSEATYNDDGNVAAVPGTKRDLTVSERFRRWIENHLFMTRLILFYTNKLLGYRDLTIRGVVNEANPEIVQHTLASDTIDRTEQWRGIFDSILRIKHYCDENSIEFALTIYPWGHQVSGNEWIPGRYAFMAKNAVVSDRSVKSVVKFSNSANIRLINLFPAFKAYQGSQPLYFKYDMHWTAAGHQVVAESMGRFLTDNFSQLWCR